MATKAARSRAPILITGETGTGKEIVARAIHSMSPRDRGPFVAINCSAIPETLLESELFGYRRGAHSEARIDKPGLFLQADRGTLFLDEIAEMSPRLQVKILRVLQDKDIRPLGATRTVSVNIRIIAATNQNPEEAIQTGAFRQDLYYRLNVFQLGLPPLRERTADIPILANHFVTKFNQEYDFTVEEINTGALNILRRHTWPGNVRELENVIHRAVVMAETGNITRRHLPANLFDTTSQPNSSESPPQEINIKEGELQAEISAALTLPPGARSEPRRIGQTIPLEHILIFFQASCGEPFAPRDFADHITPPGLRNRRNKLASKMLQALHQAGVLKRNNGKSQGVRYALEPIFLIFPPKYQETSKKTANDKQGR